MIVSKWYIITTVIKCYIIRGSRNWTRGVFVGIGSRNNYNFWTRKIYQLNSNLTTMCAFSVAKTAIVLILRWMNAFKKTTYLLIILFLNSCKSFYSVGRYKRSRDLTRMARGASGKWIRDHWTCHIFIVSIHNNKLLRLFSDSWKDKLRKIVTNDRIR